MGEEAALRRLGLLLCVRALSFFLLLPLGLGRPCVFLTGSGVVLGAEEVDVGGDSSSDAGVVGDAEVPLADAVDVAEGEATAGEAPSSCGPCPCMLFHWRQNCIVEARLDGSARLPSCSPTASRIEFCATAGPSNGAWDARGAV